MKTETRYVVINENALGYVLPGGMIGILASSIIRGGPSCMNGPISPGASDVVRDATQADFDSYRVSSRGHLTECQPEPAYLESLNNVE